MIGSKFDEHFIHGGDAPSMGEDWPEIEGPLYIETITADEIQDTIDDLYVVLNALGVQAHDNPETAIRYTQNAITRLEKMKQLI